MGLDADTVSTMPCRSAGAGSTPSILPSMIRLLLVADDRWVENDVAAAITDPGVQIDTVRSSAEATERLASHTYALVIADMQVGSMGGMAITKSLKHAMDAEDVEAAPILLLLDRPADAFLARRAGADTYLVKPFTAQELRAATSRLGSQVESTAL